jgi:hypothetical protein
MRKILIAFVLSVLAGPALAADNYTATAGSGLTFAAKDNGSAVYFPRHIMCDNTTTTQCVAVDASGRITLAPNQSVSLASGQVASGAYASGAFASGAFASGSVASGAFASGALAAGAGTDGWDVTKGAKADSACGTATGTCSIVALLKYLNTAAGLPLPAQSGTTTNIGMVNVQAAANGGASTTGNIAANNTTAVVVKASAGTLYGVQLAGIGSAPAYLKIYNATSATCGSGTPVKRLMIPAASTAANGAGSNITFGAAGVAFGTGITYCVTTGIGDADTTAPAASTFLINIDYN